MAESFGPFDAGPGAGLVENDYMDDLGPYLAGGDGVVGVPPTSNALQVYGNSSGRQVFVRAGKAVVRGGKYKNDADILITIAANTSGQTRIDRVVLRHDRTANTVHPVVILGTPGASAPAVTQTVGGTWDVKLAQVTVANGATTIAAGNVADERDFLPMHVRIADSRIGLGAADGSLGFTCYDVNPAVMALMVANGTVWAPAVTNADTNWQSLTPTTTDWIATPGTSGIKYRIRNGEVDFVFDVTANSELFVPQLCTLPSAAWPSYQRFRSVPILDSTHSPFTNPQVLVDTGFVQIDSDGVVYLGATGTSIQRFAGYAHYTAG